MQNSLAPCCPKCGGFTRVINTFHEREKYNFVRERKCRDCGYKFITRQAPEHILEKSSIVWPQSFKDSRKLVDVVPTYRLEAAK